MFFMYTLKFPSIFLIAILFSPCVTAQENILTVTHTWGTLSVLKDPRIDQLLSDYRSFYKKRSFINGYRIQIFSGSKSEALQNKTEYYKIFPDFSSDVALVYEAPNWKVHVGIYRQKRKASKNVVEIRSRFKGAIVVKSKIRTRLFHRSATE